MRCKIGHQLRIIRNTDEILSRLDKTYDLTVELDILINNGQLVAERYVVCIGIFIREPDTVLGLGIVFLAADKRKEGHRRVACDRHCERIRAAVNRCIHREVARGGINAVNRLYAVEGSLIKAALGIDAVVGKVRCVERGIKVAFDSVPLHVEADEHSYADDYHQHHRDELDAIDSYRSP